MNPEEGKYQLQGFSLPVYLRAEVRDRNKIKKHMGHTGTGFWES